MIHKLDVFCIIFLLSEFYVRRNKDVNYNKILGAQGNTFCTFAVSKRHLPPPQREEYALICSTINVSET
ncbi:hypothetical protein L2E82_14609 [Cichorium intybus]|uniref:Uncharacterized protein n=1 Tax=Cichorium intybus TaxID=13427 RepID=A0ACB9F1B9_CICIN|nr:hypothetical protein L2E82_14609 [Cichorium intybus]